MMSSFINVLMATFVVLLFMPTVRGSSNNFTLETLFGFLSPQTSQDILHSMPESHRSHFPNPHDVQSQLEKALDQNGRFTDVYLHDVYAIHKHEKWYHITMISTGSVLPFIVIF